MKRRQETFSRGFDLRRKDSLYHLCEILGAKDLVDQLWFRNLHARREKRYIDPRV